MHLFITSLATLGMVCMRLFIGLNPRSALHCKISFHLNIREVGDIHSSGFSRYKRDKEKDGKFGRFPNVNDHDQIL